MVAPYKNCNFPKKNDGIIVEKIAIRLLRIFVQTSIVVLFMTSSFAHLLNCISFRARHICFCSDYAAILYYTIGCALVNAATVVPNIIWNNSFLTADLYLRLVYL